LQSTQQRIPCAPIPRTTSFVPTPVRAVLRTRIVPGNLDSECGRQGQTRLSGSAAAGGVPADTQPDWSPDGTKILFTDSGIWTMNPDGSGRTRLGPGGNAIWQPIPINSYPRPKGATPFKTYLVPAFKQCTAPDRTHGGPLAFGSCSLPQQTSSSLTVGTPDSNGLAPTSRGSVQYTTVGSSSTPANDADVKIDVDILGVLNKSGLSPYSGQVSADVGLRITDKNNAPAPGGPGAATVQDGSFPVTVPCASSLRSRDNCERGDARLGSGGQARDLGTRSGQGLRRRRGRSRVHDWRQHVVHGPVSVRSVAFLRLGDPVVERVATAEVSRPNLQGISQPRREGRSNDATRCPSRPTRRQPPDFVGAGPCRSRAAEA
jgi:hypothetical protein